MKADYLIVGQGLAGSVLGWILEQKGFDVWLLNDTQLPSATRVAGGIFNPVTGKKLMPTWKSDELFGFAYDFYDKMQKMLNVNFLHFTNIYRPFRSIEEQNVYMAQTAHPDVSKYILPEADNVKYTPFIDNKYGGLEITGSGWIDCELLLDSVKEHFEQKNKYIHEKIDYENINILRNEILYKNLKIKKIIFCEGYHATDNPYFNWLPFNPVKGQVLEVVIEKYTIQEIVNQGTFIMPIDGKGRCKIGATYSWHDIDWEITEDGRMYILERLKYLKMPFTILNQRIGLRPATIDRRPFVGIHPAIEQLAVFNGLGTKGITLAPYFANEFAEYLSHQQEINPEVNIQRFFSLYKSHSVPV